MLQTMFSSNHFHTTQIKFTIAHAAIPKSSIGLHVVATWHCDKSGFVLICSPCSKLVLQTQLMGGLAQQKEWMSCV
jgi:hypothetical protein